MKKFFNLNTLQTVISALLVAIPVLLTKLGCTLDPAGLKIDCSQSTVITPSLALWFTVTLAVAKFVIVPWLQPGGLLANLFAPKVPISTTGDPGTVRPSQVQK